MAEIVTEIAQKVREIIAEQLGVEPETLTEKTSLEKDLNADSLDAVEIVMNLEENFDIRIPDEDARKLIIVGEIIKYIEGKIKEKKNTE